MKSSFFEEGREGRGGSLCQEKLHGHVVRTHHHLALVVVKIRFVLEWMTEDEYGNSEREGSFHF